ncbi:MAG: ribulokinase [Acidimicrobiia bacterium]|nr:ribulokinase [Acidimicrobiia bacterium]
MALVMGVDFGTQSARASVFCSDRGRLGAAEAEYPVLRREGDAHYAGQRHEDHMRALEVAARGAVGKAGVKGEEIAAIALDTTGSTVVAVGEGLEPLDDYYLWCDHRASEEAAEITAHARKTGLEALAWCGGVYSSEWGFAKLLHWLRHNPDKRERMTTALEHCDLVAATLCGIRDAREAPRSVCAMGHKWMWNAELGGLPPEEFLSGVDPLLKGVRAKLEGRYLTSDGTAGKLSAEWAGRLGLRAGIPVPVGALDAHWDAVGVGIREGDVVNVVGTSTCIMAVGRQVKLTPGVCGVVKGSIVPGLFGVEAGLSATGDIFQAVAGRAGRSVPEMSAGLEKFRAGQTGLLRMSWDNGDRTVLVNPELSGVTLGWTLASTPQDEMFAAIEGTALHTRIILERMAEYGTPIERVINGGGIPQRNEVLNRVYANALGKPVLVPAGEVTSLGSAIFAVVAAGVFQNVEEAQQRMGVGYRTVEPEAAEVAAYEELYRLYRKLYFGLGERGAEAVAIGDVLPELARLRSRQEG